MHIVQIVSRIGPGTGIGGVAWNLEREFLAQGHTVERFSAVDALGPARRARTRFRHLLRTAWREVLLTVVGTKRARRFLADRPDAVALSHNAVIAGAVYVDHGIPLAAVLARGSGVLRVLRNPTLWFGWLRDSIRFRLPTHRAIVVPSQQESSTLRRVYGRVRPEIRVIPNGVDLDAFRPPDGDERARARAALGLEQHHRVALFIGHELRWKGVPLLIDALGRAPDVLLLVVGGDGTTIAMMRSRAERQGVAERVHFAGPTPHVLPLYHAADMFVLPSGYESFSLVIAEALACGLPVIATAVGCAPDLISEGVSGYIVTRDPAEIADRMQRVAGTQVDAWRTACRESVTSLAWPVVAARYLDLLAEQPGTAR
ncbi:MULTISPECIES: glycosyltransferase family 4 protein [Microbacterium]|uniref:glycosyltransferase family 4 protein n=1 Tax=Microbacterium TaxID=33882 RepID=UPI00217D53CA|nr:MULTISPECIES: glycosyltransferase family 4 protein [Microbacterium]UWF77897.1 glycosyltransferase family 4 protein [Microbacterium neungamense]WCM56074.1 glycosyltransferase family 4 protein [Microbacterium sp. EF45047]